MEMVARLHHTKGEPPATAPPTPIVIFCTNPDEEASTFFVLPPQRGLNFLDIFLHSERWENRGCIVDWIQRRSAIK